MTDRNIPVTEDELHAYVDNELPAERRSDVEAWLATHPDDAARVQSWRAMAEALHARYDSVIDEAVPKRLDIERLVQQPRKWVYGAIAATLAAFIVGGGTRWLAARPGPRALPFPKSDGGRDRSAPALRCGSAASRRGAGQRTQPSAAMADQALRLGRPRARTGGGRIEAGRRAAVAGFGGSGILHDVRERLGRTL